MASGAFLELEQVSKSYRGQRVLDAVNLDVARGSFVALVGPSGSGKTTLLKSINRLVEIDAGSVRLDGEDVRHTAAPELRRRIGYAFQGIGLFPHMSVAENIAIVPRLLGVTAAERSARVAELLLMVGLPGDYASRGARELSGGQAQRIGFARALAARPPLMLMDEPFGALDPVTRDELGRAYRELHDRLGLTTVMVTHDMTEALLLADRIAVLVGGRIIADAAPKDLLGCELPAEAGALIDVAKRQAERLAALQDRR